MNDRVSIILPHFRTEEMVRLCLKCLREYTDPKHPVIVIDNGSGDHPSLDYLRTVPWIKLLVREPHEINKNAPISHREALDLGLAHAETDYVLSLHTDAFALRKDWLDWMLKPMLENDKLGAVGTYKLEYKPYWKQWATDLKHHFRRQDPSSLNAPYIRSHCALYSKRIMEDINLSFMSEQTTGRELHFSMLDNGYDVSLLPVRQMSKYVAHINHGTMVINKEFGVRQKSITAGEKRILKFYQSKEIQHIYNKDYTS